MEPSVPGTSDDSAPYSAETITCSHSEVTEKTASLRPCASEVGTTPGHTPRAQPGALYTGATQTAEGRYMEDLPTESVHTKAPPSEWSAGGEHGGRKDPLGPWRGVPPHMAADKGC